MFWLVCSGAGAAPVDIPATAAVRNNASTVVDSDIEPAGPSTRPAARAGANRKGTVDLLIELQPQSAGLEFKERVPSREHAGAVTGGGARPGAEAEGSSRALFGAGATPTLASQKVQSGSGTVWSGSTGTQTEPSRAYEAPKAAGDGRSLLPREMIDFLRQNRPAILAAAAVLLALIWGGTMALGGRGRR
jgi:hypothetical protein